MQNKDVTLDPSGIELVYNTVTTGAGTALLAADVSVALNTFFTATTGGIINPIAGYMSESIDRTHNWTWEAYNITNHLDGTPHGAPISSGAYAWPGHTPQTGPMPEGVAACLSFRRDYGTDVEFVRDPTTGKVIARPRGQDRGRMYLGPLNPLGLQIDSTTSRTKLTATFCSDLLKAMQNALKITDSGSNLWHLSQWSRKKASVADLALMWIDDRPDYQRRRADQSTVRQSAIPSY